RKLELTRVVALIDPGNVASERVAGRIGMRFERDVVRPGGGIRRVYTAGTAVAHPASLLRRLKYGSPSWNAWRAANPDLTVVLDGADLSGLILTGIDLSAASLRGPTLRATNV